MTKHDLVSKAINFLIVASTVIALAVACTQIASAQTIPTQSVKMTWVAPTTHTDGTPITTPLKYAIYNGAKGFSPGVSTVPLQTTATGVLTATVTVPANAACFRLTAVEGITESALTNEVCAPTVPNAPTNLTVTIVVTVTQP